MKTLLHVCAFMWIESMLFANSVVKWFCEAIDLERIMSMRILRATCQLKTVWLLASFDGVLIRHIRIDSIRTSFANFCYIVVVL